MSEVDRGTLSITYHPEGPLLAEGSPGMLQPEMLWLGSHQKTYVPLVKSLESAIQSDTFREILRATQALQDDKWLKASGERTIISPVKLVRRHRHRSR